MPLHVLDAEHGHKAIFLHASASLSLLSHHVSWGPCSIAVPSSSPLNGPADVWLRVPRFDEHAARRWCERHNATFLAAWPATSEEAPTGFGFRVTGFSRYRYVESDDDPEGEEGEHADTEKTASERRRARTHAAGRTPVRPAARRTSPGRTPVRKTATAPTPRARLTPSVALYDSDEDEEEDDEAVEETDGEGPESDGVDDSVAMVDPFRPTAWGAGVDAPQLSKLRAALFDEPLAYGKMGYGEGAYAGEPQREEEDVAMEDIHMGEYDDPEDERYNMFDPSPRREGDRQGEVDARPEAGDFVIDGEMRPRRQMADAFFPPTSLPFPTVEGSIAAGKEGITSDKGLMLGRSTRVSFSHSGLLVRPCYGVSEGDAFATPGFVTDVANLYVGSADVPRESLSKMLRVHCGAWFASVTADDKQAEKGPPVRVPTLKDSFVYPEVADATIEQFIEELKFCHEEGGDVNALHAQVALWMLLALYKKENDLAFGGGDTLLKRVALWAGGPAGTAFDEESNCRATGLRSALISLSLGNIEEAVSTATRAGHLRLALLIARALESPKDDLRADAEAQLATYGLSLRREEDDLDVRQDDEANSWQWDDILEECPNDAAVSVDERMILLVLSGHVAPVARYLGLSWYRLFIMEFFHGAGSSDLTQAERVSAAVEAISASEISTGAPHGCTQDLDVVYHLLRLYADPTASYSLTSGVYANGSCGSVYSPLDARFSWLTYQILTAVIPQASTPNALQVLADEFSSQLRAAGLHLWSYYVLGSGSAPPDVMKSALIREWPSMESDFVEWIPAHGLESATSRPKRDGEDTVASQKFEDVAGQLGAELFLEEVLGVPREWIAEAKAVAAHVEGDHLEECKHWIATGTEDGASRAHEVLTNQVFPDMVSYRDSSRYGEVVEVLRHLEASKHVADWSISGGLILNYLEYVVGVPKVKRQPLVVYRGMVNLVRSWATRATTPEQHHTATVIADGIAAAERAQLFHAKAEDRDTMLEQVVEDLERLPCSRGAKLRAAGEYKIEAEHGRVIALRFSASYPPYARFMDPVEAVEG